MAWVPSLRILQVKEKEIIFLFQHNFDFSRGFPILCHFTKMLVRFLFLIYLSYRFLQDSCNFIISLNFLTNNSIFIIFLTIIYFILQQNRNQCFEIFGTLLLKLFKLSDFRYFIAKYLIVLNQWFIHFTILW